MYVVVGLVSMCRKILLGGRSVGVWEGGSHRNLWGFVQVIAYRGKKLLCIVFQMGSL